MTIQSSTVNNTEKSFGFHNSYNDLTRLNNNNSNNANISTNNNNNNNNGKQKILGPLSQSKLSYYSNSYLTQKQQQQQQQQLHQQSNMKKSNIQHSNYNGSGIPIHQPNLKASNNNLIKNNYQQHNAMRSESNGSELKAYEDSDEYYSNTFKNNNASTTNKSKLPLPALQKNSLHNQHLQAQLNNTNSIVLKQQNMNLNMDNLNLKKTENDLNSFKKRQSPINENHVSRKTIESNNNSNGGVNGNQMIINSNIKLNKKKTQKTNLFSPEPKNSNGQVNAENINTNLANDLNQRQRSISLMNGTHPLNAKSRLTSSTRLSINSSLTSSCSSIINNIEETENLYDLSDLIKKYLIKIEKDFSLEKLYIFVKTNIKFNGYRNFTLDSLEPHLATISTLGTYNNNETSMTKTPSIRSYSQVRKSNSNTPYLMQNYQNSNYDLNGRNVMKKVKPVENLFRNIRIFKSLLMIIQKNMLDDLLGLDTIHKPLTPIKPVNYSPNNAHTEQNAKQDSKNPRPNSKTLTNLNYVNNSYQKTNAQNIQILNNNEIDHKTKMKFLQLLNAYNHKLYDLNENLNIIINDQSSCDLKLLSAESNLPSKYEYKNGEYIMRLTTDIIIKIRKILLICEKVYKINFKLNGNFNPIRISKISKPSLDDMKGSVDILDDLDENNNEFFDLDEKDDSQILKQIIRKKTKTVQLPKLLQRVDTKTANLKNSNTKIINNITDETDIGPYNSLNENIERVPKQQTQKQYHQEHEPVLSETPQLTNNKTNNNNNNQHAINIQNNIKKLSKQDSTDSFIQDTDCSSIISDTESMVYYDYINEVYAKSPSTTNNKNTNSNLKKISKTDMKLEKQNSFNSTVNSELYKVEDRNKLFEAYQNIRTQIELTNQMIRDLNIYMQTLLQRAERCAKLEEQLHSDKELIKKTENSLKLYTADKFLNSGDVLNKLSQNKMNELFKTQLEKQLDYLHYRFKLNYQDLNLEQMCAPEIGAAILDTEQKLKTLNVNLKVLNKNLSYVEFELFERPKLLNSNSNTSNHYITPLYEEKNVKSIKPRQKPLPPLANGTTHLTPQNQYHSNQHMPLAIHASNHNNQNYYK